jgi:type II protein arginine methyltransferase
MGDNELSPECLDGIQHVLKKSGISIPSSYKSFIAPISSSSLFAKTQSLQGRKHIEIPYVVKFRDIFPIADPVAIWEFNHPNQTGKMNPLGHPDFNCHNTRFSSKSFDVKDDCLLHGFAAYFESVLYKKTILSILPSSHSPNMTSWFPMFFPSKVF